MITLELNTEVQPDGTLKLEIPGGLQPGPVQVVLVIQPQEERLSWRQLRGLGREIWASGDAQEYVNRLRDEWKP